MITSTRGDVSHREGFTGPCFLLGNKGPAWRGALPTWTAQSRGPIGPVIRNWVAWSQGIILPCNEIWSFPRVSQIECKYPFLLKSEQNEGQELCIFVCFPEKAYWRCVSLPHHQNKLRMSCYESSLRICQHSLPLSLPVGLKLCKHVPSQQLLVTRPVYRLSLGAPVPPGPPSAPLCLLVPTSLQSF